MLDAFFPEKSTVPLFGMLMGVEKVKILYRMRLKLYKYFEFKEKNTWIDEIWVVEGSFKFKGRNNYKVVVRGLLTHLNRTN